LEAGRSLRRRVPIAIDGDTASKFEGARRGMCFPGAWGCAVDLPGLAPHRCAQRGQIVGGDGAARRLARAMMRERRITLHEAYEGVRAKEQTASGKTTDAIAE